MLPMVNVVDFVEIELENESNALSQGTSSI